MGVGGSKYYVRVDEKSRIDHDVVKLHKAMRGLGTDEANLIRTLVNLSPDQLQAVRVEFNKRYGAKGGDLIQWIKDDTSGDFRDFCVALASDEAEVNAKALHDAMKGLGTDDKQLIEILCNQSPVQIERTKAAFEAKYGNAGSLADWISDDTSGDYRKALLALVDRPKYYAKRIHDAIAGPGTDDDTLIRMLITLKQNESIRRLFDRFKDPLGTAADLLADLEDELWAPPLDDVKKAYVQMYNRTLEDDVRNDTSGNYQKVLMALISPEGKFGAEQLHKAMAGMGTDEAALIQGLVTHSPRERMAIAKSYAEQYSTTLEDAIKDDTSFNFKSTLLALLRPRATNQAIALREAMKGLGTDEAVLTRLICHRSKKQLREIAAEYKRLYNRDLRADVRSETSGWYRKGLDYILREADQERVHVPQSLMLRIRDVDR